MGKKKIKGLQYYLQKAIGNLLRCPIIPNGRSVGYSVVRSEKSNCEISSKGRITPPFFLQNVKMGDYSYLSKNPQVSNTIIGKFCSIGPNFCCGLGIHPTNCVSTSPMFYSTDKQNGTTLCKRNKIEEHLTITIGNDVWIGANVTILDGVCINDGAVIGAGAVVTKDVPPYSIVVGIPAKVIKYRFDDATIERLIHRQWWNNESELKAVEENFFDIEAFLSK